MKRQQMNLVFLLERAQLTARDNTDAEPLTCGASRGNAGDAVVIGQGDRGEIAALRRFDYPLRRESSVRRS